MAKELPYFKFYVSEWSDGDITLEDMEVQGLFINLCAYYWSNECELSYAKTLKKFRSVDVKHFDTLIENEIIKEVDGFIIISFLDEQRKERGGLCSQNSINAKNGWKKRKAEAERKRTQSESYATALKPQSETDTESMQYREEEKREEEKREEQRKKESVFEKFWDVYGKKQDRKKCLSKFLKLKESELEAIRKHLPLYLKSVTDKQYLKNPLTYLNGECWNDDIINQQETKPKSTGFLNPGEVPDDVLVMRDHTNPDHIKIDCDNLMDSWFRQHLVHTPEQCFEKFKKEQPEKFKIYERHNDKTKPGNVFSAEEIRVGLQHCAKLED
tara:strand:+ start:1186 stop:2169 length:984 start_codon:yes stop_codon:yes gene_type:complete